MRRDTWQALRSRVVFVNAPLERSESDSSARIGVSILRKISIGTVQIFQYRYLSKYRYFWQHYRAVIQSIEIMAAFIVIVWDWQQLLTGFIQQIKTTAWIHICIWMNSWCNNRIQDTRATESKMASLHGDVLSQLSPFLNKRAQSRLVLSITH